MTTAATPLPDSGGAHLLRMAIAESIREQHVTGELPARIPTPLSREDVAVVAGLMEETKPRPAPAPRRTTMYQIDPIEFGKLQAQVQSLIESDKTKTALLTKMADRIDTMGDQIAQARGGWQMLMAVGGFAAALGSLATWALQSLQHFKPPGGSP